MWKRRGTAVEYDEGEDDDDAGRGRRRRGRHGRRGAATRTTGGRKKETKVARCGVAINRLFLGSEVPLFQYQQQQQQQQLLL